MTTPLLDIASVTKQYGALRPFRLERFTVLPGDQVALVGFDEPTAEILTALITGVALPDVGSVSLFGRLTSQLGDADQWLTHLDRIGVVSDRAVLLESLTVVQNLAMPFTLDIDPPPEPVAAAARALAAEVTLDEEMCNHPVGTLDPASTLRVRLARALALEPSLLVLEHPAVHLSASQAGTFARDLRALASRRGLATVVLTASSAVAAATASKVLHWEPATGGLRDSRASSWWPFRRS